MRAILTASRVVFAILRAVRETLSVPRVIILDRARWERDGDWHLWQDDGEVGG